MSIDQIRSNTDALVAPGRIETHHNLSRRLKGERDVKIIQIPVHPKETRLDLLLSAYANRSDIHHGPFRVVILINNGTPEETQQRLAEVEVFTHMYPDFPLECYFSQIPGVFQNISYVRAALSRLALEGLPDHTQETLNRSLFVSHDADLIELYPDYFDHIDETFHDPNLLAIGGGIEYRTESPLLRVLHRVDEEFYKLGLADGNMKPKMCGGNSVFRGSAFVDASGYNLAFRRKVTAPIRDYTLKNAGSLAVRYVPEVALATSARRAVACLNLGGSFSNQHESFGKPGDYMDTYLETSSDRLSLDNASEAQRNDFLGRQLTGILEKSIYLKSSFVDAYAFKHRRKGLRAMMPYVLSEPQFAEMRESITGMFAEACRRSRVDVEISDNLMVTVKNYVPTSNRLDANLDGGQLDLPV